MNNTLPVAFFVSLLITIFSCREDDKEIPEQPPVLKTGEFKNPVLSSAPDPWVFRSGEWYYFTHTTGNSLRLYRTKKMSDLAKAEVKTIWSPPVSGMNAKNIWAPEIHYVHGKWYFYYAADNGQNANHRMWVLENESEDPFTGTWTDKGKLALPDDKWAIDGTIFEHNDKLYYLWSGWEGDSDVRQDIYIVEMSDPITPIGPRIRLCAPELPWETYGAPPGVNEGPQFFRHGEKIFIAYSASGCWTDHYAIGLLSASAASDVLDPASWTKSADPVFSGNPSGSAFAPGHNGFFTSPDGTEDWIIYHANASAGMGCGNGRSVRIQKFTWNDEGSPVFGKPVPLQSVLKKPSGEDQ